MPYTKKQVRLFQAIKHGSVQKKGLSKGKAAQLLSHDSKGTKPPVRKT